MAAKDGISQHVEYSKNTTMGENNNNIKIESKEITRLETVEQQYHVSAKTYLVLLIMGLTLGTCQRRPADNLFLLHGSAGRHVYRLLGTKSGTLPSHWTSATLDL